MELSRVSRAYDAVRSGRIHFPISEIERIWREAHVTEFFSNSDEHIVATIEALEYERSCRNHRAIH